MRIDKPEKVMGHSVAARHHLTEDEADAPLIVSALRCSLLMRQHVVPSNDNFLLAAAHFCCHWPGSLLSAAACLKQLAGHCWRNSLLTNCWLWLDGKGISFGGMSVMKLR